MYKTIPLYLTGFVVASAIMKHYSIRHTGHLNNNTHFPSHSSYYSLWIRNTDAQRFALVIFRVTRSTLTELFTTPTLTHTTLNDSLPWYLALHGSQLNLKKTNSKLTRCETLPASYMCVLREHIISLSNLCGLCGLFLNIESNPNLTSPNPNIT